jgi:hypothetical protein
MTRDDSKVMSARGALRHDGFTSFIRILTLPTSTLSLLDQSKTSRILSVLSFPKLRIVRGCLVLGYGPLRRQQGSRQDAPRVLGTSRSEEEFQAYRSILTAGQPADKATRAESFCNSFQTAV